MGQLLKYPNGFVARATPLTYYALSEADHVQHEIVETGPNAFINALYKHYTSKSANSSKWAFRRRAIYYCAQLFGDFKDWLALQLVRNDNIYGLNLSFLHDTVQYIRTGKRDQSMNTWKVLLDNEPYPEPQVGVANRHRMNELRIVDDFEFDNYIGQWLSHPNGLEDMLWTAQVLFGSSKSRLLNHPLV